MAPAPGHTGELFDSDNDRNPLKSPGPKGTNEGHNSTHTADIEVRPTPIERAEGTTHSHIDFGEKDENTQIISRIRSQIHTQEPESERVESRIRAESPEAKARPREPPDTGIEIRIDDRQKRRRKREEHCSCNQHQCRQYEQEAREDELRECYRVDARCPDHKMHKPSPQLHCRERSEEKQEINLFGEHKTPPVDIIPLFSDEEWKSTLKEQEEAQISFLDIYEDWYNLSTSPTIVDTVEALLNQANVETGVEECIKHWFQVRNTYMMTYLLASICRDTDSETLTRAIQHYTEHHTALYHIPVDDPVLIEHLPIGLTMAMMHPTLWPQVEYSAEEHALIENRAALFGWGPVEFLRLKGRFPSMETEDIELRYEVEIREEMSRRWEELTTRAQQFIIAPFTGNWIIDIGLSELLNQATFEIGALLTPITVAEQELIISIHEWDPCVAIGAPNIEIWSLNDEKNTLKRRQLQQKLRERELLERVATDRAPRAQKQELRDEEIHTRMRALITTRVSKRHDLVSLETPTEEIIGKCLEQWNTDYNYTFLCNLQDRKQINNWDMDMLVAGIREYKEQSAGIRGNELIAPKYDYLTALMITNPQNWPAINDAERTIRLRDPRFRRSVERFGWTLTELAGLYGHLPEWESRIPNPEREAKLRETIEERENETLAYLGADCEHFRLWYFILLILCYQLPIPLNEIYQVQGLCMVPNVHTHANWMDHINDFMQTSSDPDTTTDSSTAASDEEHAEAHGEPRRRHEVSSESSDDEPEENPHAESEEDDFEQQLRQILLQRNIEDVQRGLEEMMETYGKQPQIRPGLTASIVDCLTRKRGQKWPKPRYGVCPHRTGCETEYTSAGKLRLHLAHQHQLDTTKTRDELHVILQILIGKEIKGVTVKHDGERILVDHERGGPRIKAPLKCHFCQFIAVKDDILEDHWTHKHLKQYREMKHIGIFWTKIRHWLSHHKRFPTVLEMLGEYESLRCQLCGDHRNSPENMTQHLRCHHDISDPSRFDVVNNTYIIEEMQMADIFPLDSPEEQESEDGGIEEEPPINTVAPLWPHIPRAIYDELDEWHISETTLQMVLSEKDKEAFKMMFKIALEEGPAYTAAFVSMVKFVKAEKQYEHLDTEKSDIGDLLWNLDKDEWPSLMLGHCCARCDACFPDKDTYFRHRSEHVEPIVDVAPIRDFMRLHMPETVISVVTTSEIVKLERPIKRCEVAGCGFCYEQIEEYKQHLERMLTNEEHVEFITNNDAYGVIYGPIRYLTKKFNRLPMIGELLGNTTKTVCLCATCHAIVPKNENAQRRHYAEMMHPKKRREWYIKARLTERNADQDALKTHFDVLIRADRKELDKMIDELEQRMLREAPEEPETEEGRLQDERARRAHDEREARQQREMLAEHLFRNRAREEGADETEMRQRWNENREQIMRDLEPELPPEEPQEDLPPLPEPERVPDSDPDSDSTTNNDEEATQPDQPDEHGSSHSESDDPELSEDSEELETTEVQPPTRPKRTQAELEARERVRAQRLAMLFQHREELQHEESAEERQQRKKWARALRWREEGLEREQRGFQLPKMSRETRKQVQEGLRDLWKDEILPILENYEPEEGDEDQWLGFEGAIYRMEDLLRTHAMRKMGRNPETMYRKKRREVINKERLRIAEEESRIGRAVRIANKMEQLQAAEEGHHERDIRLLTNKIKKRIGELSENERQRWWNTDNVDEIFAEVQRHIYDHEAYGNWLDSTIVAARTELEQTKRCSINAKRLQEEYSDNANRTMRNLIWKEERPECCLAMNIMLQHTKATMRREDREEESTEDFTSPRAVPMEMRIDEEMFEYITDLDNITKAISSRQWNSAPGVDGLDYALYKSGGKEAARALQQIIRVVAKHQRAPIQFKTSRTVYIYKKGDTAVPSNWRPLTISNAMYRIIMVLMSWYITDLNKSYDILEPSQKGFIEGVNGTAENILTLTELFNDAERRHKSLYVAALDFQNAFGSVNHEYMYQVLAQKGLPATFNNIIRSIYDASTTRLDMKNKISSCIDIKKGMKQGCPLSPLLFNISIDPLIRKLNERTDLGYKVGEDSFTVQAYADDIILISSKEEHLNRLIQIVQEFTKISGTRLAPHKCVAYTYALTPSQTRTYTANIKIGEESIPNARKEDTIRYLGAPIAAHRNERMSKMKLSLAQFAELLQKIVLSKLCIVQKVHAIKTFLLPKLDYEMVTNQIKVHTLQMMDRAIRTALNREIGAKLPKAVYHASWKDGGLGIPSIEDRQKVSVVRAFLCMLTSRHQKVKNLMDKALKDERKKRHIEEDESGPFLGWKVTPETNLQGTRGTASLAARACRATLDLGLTLKERQTMTSTKLELASEQHTVEVTTQSSANSTLLELMRAKWQDSLAQHTFHLHSFGSLIKNKESNAFVPRIDNPVKDSFIKFVLKARTNTLPTKEFIEIMRGIPHTGCSACGAETNESLQHILNGCPCNSRLIMDRHDSIVRYLRDTVQEHRPEYTYAVTDGTVREVDIQENRLLKPDVQLWTADRDRVILIEVNVPYAKNWEGRDSLEEKYNIKVDKYRDLTRELEARGVETEFYAVVVSSLGALYPESQKAIFQMLRSDRQCRTVCRMVSSKAINGSATIWRENRRHHPENRLHDGEGPPDPEGIAPMPDEATLEIDVEDIRKRQSETETENSQGTDDSAEEDDFSSDEYSDSGQDSGSETETESEDEAEVMTDEELALLLADVDPHASNSDSESGFEDSESECGE